MFKLFIHAAEEQALGISEAQTRQWRQEYSVPDSDFIDQFASPDKRARAGTVSSGSEVSASDKLATNIHRKN
jgi:hypothetical protein